MSENQQLIEAFKQASREVHEESESRKLPGWVVTAILTVLSGMVGLIVWFGREYKIHLDTEIATGRQERAMSLKAQSTVAVALEGIVTRLDIHEEEISRARLDPWTGQNDKEVTTQIYERVAAVETKANLNSKAINEQAINYARIVERMETINRLNGFPPLSNYENSRK